MDRLNAMEVFVRVVETGSFAAAADQLDLARSVVTRQVAGLEAHLGAKLLARSTRRLALTPAGATYLDKCREILNLVQAAEGDLAGEQRVPRGPIRMAAPMSFGQRHLMPIVGDFSLLYPEVDLDLEFNDRRINLIEEGVDLAIRITGRLDPTQVARRLSVCRLALLAAPDYLARHGRPLRLEDLAEHPCLAYTPTLRSRWTFRDGDTIREIEVGGKLRANNGDALVEAAVRGLGITYQPTFIAAPAIRAGQLEVLLPGFPPPDIGIYAIFPGQRHLPHRVRMLVEYIAARIGPEPFWDEGLLPGRP